MKMMLTAFHLFLISLTVTAQPTIDWQKSLGGDDPEEAQTIQQTSDGGYIVAGYSNSNNGDVSGNHGLKDVWLVKLNSAGSIEWEKSLGGSGEEVAYSIQQTTDGGYILAGYSTSNDGDVSGNHGGTDFWIVKLTSAGVIEWQKSLGGSDFETAKSIQQTTDGGYIVAGHTNSSDGNVSSNHGLVDVWVVKMTSSGVIEWEKSYGGTEYDFGNCIVQSSDGGYVFVGYSNSNDGDVTGNHGVDDIWVVKITSTGVVDWEKSLGGTSHEAAYSIKQTTDAGFIIVGFTASNDGDVSGNHGYEDYWVVKLGSTGFIEWQKALGGTGIDYGHAIQETSDGNYLVAGYTSSTDGNVTVNYGLFDTWILQLNSTGTIVWQKSFGGSSYETIYSALQASDGGFIFAGWSASTDGDVTGNHGSADFWVVKLSAYVGLDESAAATKISVHPNPASQFITLNTAAKFIGAPYVIYGITGEVVLSGKANAENTLIELSYLPRGIYVVHVQTEEEIVITRFVKH